MTDGELLHLMVDGRNVAPSSLDERIYGSLLSIKSTSAKALTTLLAALALAILAYFKVLQRVSTSGMEISPVVFNHIALAAVSVTTAIFCISYCKLTLLNSWFAWKFKSGDASERAANLLLYPEAHWHFAFLPSNIGYPKHVFADRFALVQILYVLLIVVALCIYAVGFMGLWVALALEVWNSSEVNPLISKLTVISSISILLIGYLSPFHYDLPRKYTHYGLINLLGKLQGHRLNAAHMRIIKAQIRMGLVDPPT